jgi:hypothetical protein
MTQKFFIYYIIIGILLLTCNSIILVSGTKPIDLKSDLSQQNLKAIFGKHWIHLFEKDKGNVKVYRPSTLVFPLSRGRDGFEIMKNGTFINYGIGGGDISNKTFHSYYLNMNGNSITINVIFENNNMCIQIKSYDKSDLTIKQWFVSKANECNNQT